MTADVAAIWYPAADLNPWKDNYLIHGAAQLDIIAASIRRNGWGSACVAQLGSDRLIIGHGRLAAYLQLIERGETFEELRELDPGEAAQLLSGMVPVRFRAVPDDRAAELALADNESARHADVDIDAMDAVLARLHEEDALGGRALGLDEDAVADALARIHGPRIDHGPPAPPPKVHAPSAPTLLLGDCIESMRAMPPGSIDSVVCDPPYGLGFMGKKWDALPPGKEWAEEVLRVVKPGGHLIAFGGQRTIHRLACALEDAGWEIRDQIGWQFYSGFPKSHDISKAVDDSLGAEREIVGRGQSGANSMMGGLAGTAGDSGHNITAPATREAARWSGWGTALKPCIEPCVLARKPLAEDTIAAQVLATGTGGLNVDGCRHADGDRAWPGPQGEPSWPDGEQGWRDAYVGGDDGSLATWSPDDGGRFPANVYACPKASSSERERGCGGLPLPEAGVGALRDGDRSEERRNHHATVKPVRLMRWLCRLVTPPGGTVLDTFMGSGTTGVAATLEGFSFVGCEMEPDYMAISSARIGHAEAHSEEWAQTAPGFGAKPSA